jgi:hypothetical protein
MSTATFRWERCPYRRPGWFADVLGGRVLVVRSQPRARDFTVWWNGTHVGFWSSADEAKAGAERMYREGVHPFPRRAS